MLSGTSSDGARNPSGEAMNRHFILTNGRSGSNYFVQLLNQHPNAVNYGEVLGDWTLPGRHILPRFKGEGAAGRYLDWLYESEIAFVAGQAVSLAARGRTGRKTHFRRRTAVATIGIKEFTVNIKRFGLDNFLADRPGIRLVTLIRENPLARLLSSRTLRETGAVARTEGKSEARDAQVRLDPERIIADLDIIEAENEAVRMAARRHSGPVHEISYEAYFGADSAGQHDENVRLQQFLGLEPQTLASEHRRLRRKALPEAISNYGEIAERLAGTPYEIWLSDAF